VIEEGEKREQRKKQAKKKKSSFLGQNKVVLSFVVVVVVVTKRKRFRSRFRFFFRLLSSVQLAFRLYKYDGTASVKTKRYRERHRAPAATNSRWTPSASL
jgi:hypothetical protein